MFRRDGDKLGFEALGTVEQPQTVTLLKLDDELDALHEAVHANLVAAGLYEAEAAAMLETWKTLWFEPGLRVLYLVPRERTDELLPLAIEPAPDQLVRVMVGRLDLL